jgi:hypothetical protein
VRETSPPSPVAIVGSRHYPDLEAVRQFVRSLPKDTWVISGGAFGVDSAAEVTALECSLWVASYRPEKYGNEYRIRLYEWNPSGDTLEATVGFAETFAKAAHMRNQMIVDRAVQESGCVVAYRAAGKSNGTDSTIRKAKAAGILYETRTPDGAA